MKRLQDRNLQTLHNMLPVCDVICCYHMTTGMISKMADSDVLFQQHAVFEFFVKEENLLLKFTSDFNMLMEMSAWASAMLGDG